MSTLNRIFLEGRLTKQPELKMLGGNGGSEPMAVAEFDLAVFTGTSKKPDTSFFKCKAFGKTAEYASKFNKGEMAIVIGRLKDEKWQTKDGGNRVATKIILEQIEHVSGNHISDDATDAVQDKRPFRKSNNADDHRFQKEDATPPSADEDEGYIPF